jgi:broad specificity phosphatase PhoE
MTSIYLIRHATPDWSRTDLAYDVPPGPPLVPSGEEEARNLGKFLADLNISEALVSPLERTRRTAELALAGLDVKTTVDEDIAEWQRGEAEQDVLARMLRVINRLTEASDGSTSYAVVTHGGPIRALLHHLGMEKDALDHYRRQFDHDNPTPPAGVWKISRRSAEQSWTMELVYTPKPHKAYVPATVYV